MKLEEVNKILKYRVNNSIKISWHMTKWCNYRCHYCYMADRIESKLEVNQEKMEEIAGGINRLINDVKKPVHLQFIGGEPSIYEIIPLLKIIDTEYLSSIIIISNFSRPYQYYKDIIDYCNSRKIRVKYNASFHIEELKKRNKINDFVDKVIALRDWTSVKVMIDENNKELYHPYLDKLLYHGVYLQCGTIRDGDNKCNESEEILGFVQKYNNASLERNPSQAPYIACEDIYGNIHNYYSSTQAMEAVEGGFAPYGFQCTAGIDCLRIETHGEIYRAGCRMGLHCCLGNVLFDYELPTKPIVCTSDRNCSLCNYTDIIRINNDRDKKN